MSIQIQVHDLAEYRFGKLDDTHVPIATRICNYKGISYLVEVPAELTDDYTKGVMVDPIGFIADHTPIPCPDTAPALLVFGIPIRVSAQELKKVSKPVVLWDHSHLFNAQISIWEGIDTNQANAWKHLQIEMLPKVTHDGNKIN